MNNLLGCFLKSVIIMFALSGGFILAVNGKYLGAALIVISILTYIILFQLYRNNRDSRRKY